MTFVAATAGPIDVHVHATVSALLASPGREQPWRPTVHLDLEGRQVSVEIRGRTMSSIVGELSRLDVVMEQVRARGVERVVLSPWVSTFPRGMDPGAAADVCRLQNVAFADAVAGHDGVVTAFGAVPLQDGELAAEVLTEALGLGLAGAEVTPGIGDHQSLGDPTLEPFFEAAAALNAAVFVHPGSHGLGLDALGEYYLWNAVGNPVETAIGTAHLIMSGVMERHPNLRIVLAHGGGALASLVGRLERAFETRAEARLRLSEGPRASFHRLYFDTVMHDLSAMAALISEVGASHLVLGSDHPFDMGSSDPVADVLRLGLSTAETESILWKNAEMLFTRG